MRNANCGLRIVIGAVLLAGLGCAKPYAVVANRSEDKSHAWTVERPYQATCRLLLDAIRGEWGENRVKHDLWTDIEQASIYPSRVSSRGVDCVVRIEATGPDQCRIVASGADSFQRGRVSRVIERTLEAEGSGQP